MKHPPAVVLGSGQSVSVEVIGTLRSTLVLVEGVLMALI